MSIHLLRTTTLVTAMLLALTPILSHAQTPSHAAPIIIDQPASPPVPFNVPGRIVQFRATPTALKTIIAHLQYAADNNVADMLVAFDTSTGKPLRTFQVIKDEVVLWRAMELSSSGNEICLLTKDHDFAAFKIDTAKKAWSWAPVRDQSVNDLIRFTPDRHFASGVVDRSILVLWDLATGTAKTAKLDLPPNQGLPVDANRLLLLSRVADSSRDDPRFTIDLFDINSGKRDRVCQTFSGSSPMVLPGAHEMLLLQGKREMRPTGENTRTEVLTWTGIERWNLETRKLTATHMFDAPLEADRLKLATDGRFLFLSSYQKPVSIYDASSGNLLARIGPAQGIDCFDVTPDSQFLLALVTNPGDNDKVPPKTFLMSYDLSRLPQHR